MQVYLSQHQGEQAQRIEAATGSREGFSAGRGDKNRPELSWGHESIEEDLKLAGFNAQQRHAIYFGNWLRDYSQLLDPKLVRAIDAPKDFPAKLSREVLTQLVDLLALRAFPKLQETPQGRSEYTVTPQMLGVYRPSEHIDNPRSEDLHSFPTRRSSDLASTRISKHLWARTMRCCRSMRRPR